MSNLPQRYLLEPNKEVEVRGHAPINPHDVETGSYVLVVSEGKSKLYISQTYICTKSRDMNARQWTPVDLEDAPPELAIYLLLLQS